LAEGSLVGEDFSTGDDVDTGGAGGEEWVI
jgi:hypothetical protein